MFKTIYNKVIKDNQQELCYFTMVNRAKSKNKELSHCDHTTQEVLTTNSWILKNPWNINSCKGILNKEEGSIRINIITGMHIQGMWS